MWTDELRRDAMMAHLLDALERGMNIGHYGRLVFAMVARFFAPEDELVRYLAKDPDCSEDEARALCLQVTTHDYSPPRREKILEWQRHQDFPICPTPEDPGACNVYRDLEFPERVYEHIEEFYDELLRSKR